MRFNPNARVVFITPCIRFLNRLLQITTFHKAGPRSRHKISMVCLIFFDGTARNSELLATLVEDWTLSRLAERVKLFRL